MPLPSLNIEKQVGYLHNREYLEMVNPNMIRYIIDKGLCSDNYDLTNYSQKIAAQSYTNETAQLEAYLKKYKNSNKGIPVKYNKAKHGYGRVFPFKSLGLTSLVKKTRNTLIKDTMIDLDLSNAQPMIILNIAQANNIKCPFNEQYINNREPILAEVVETYGVTRDDAKGLFIRLAFSGCFRGWCMDCGLNEDEHQPNDFIKGFTIEIYTFAGIVKEHNPLLYKCMKDIKEKKGEDRNILGSVLAHYLQEYEYRILCCICEFLDTKTKITTIASSKLKALTYEFDGIKLLRAKVLEYGSIDFLISILEGVIYDKTGFKMKFEEKPITKFFEIEKNCSSNNEVVIIEPVVILPFTCDITLPSGRQIVDDLLVYNDLMDGVKTDVEACDKLYKLYPHFIFCQEELYVYDHNSGMLNNSKTAYLSIIKAHSEYLHLKTWNSIKGEWTISETVSYGSSLSLMEKLIPLLKTMNMNDNWIKQRQNSSLGKILFNNGYYDFKKELFYSKAEYGFNPEILFVGKIHQDFRGLDYDEVKYMDTIKMRLFHNPLGEELGNYLLLNLARALSGELMKRFLFGLGGTNGGKSILTEAICLSIGDYAGVFNAENLAYRQSSADEAAQLRWALLLRFKRIILSNEVKNGDGEKDIPLSGNLIKKISSGGDPVVGRTHNKEETPFVPHFLAICLANDMLKIKPYDDAVDARAKIMKFDKTFVDNPSNEFELKKDENLKAEMSTEKFQRCFVMLLIKYYTDWNDAKQVEGYVEVEPSIVTQGKREWVEEAEGFLSTFLKDFELTGNDKEDKVKSCDIEDWIKAKKLGVSMMKFAIEMKKFLKINNIEGVYNKDKKVAGKTSVYWLGIKRADIDDGVEEE